MSVCLDVCLSVYTKRMQDEKVHKMYRYYVLITEEPSNRQLEEPGVGREKEPPPELRFANEKSNRLGLACLSFACLSFAPVTSYCTQSCRWTRQDYCTK